MAVYVLLAAVVIGVILGYMLTPDPPTNTMEPNTLDSFQVTQASEGAVVPLVFGTVRLPGNLLWYGNLETFENKDDVGKGGGDSVTTGYDYWMDLWQSVCLGPGVSLLSGYVQDDPIDLGEFGVYYMNPGDTNYFPTEPGEFASPMHGVAHIFLDRFHLGENVSMVPTIHFVVKRDSSAPLTYANMTSGTNPAAIIYDVLIMAGARSNDFDLPSFQAAANYWYGKNYGLNMIFSKQQEVRNFIRQVFVYVDAVIRVDDDDKIVLTALTPDDTASATMVTEDFKEFEFHRRSWDDVSTDFRANLIDKDQAYTKRTIRVRNPAVKALIGYERQQTLDLSAFNDITVASARLWEMMKHMSYPEAQIECTVSMKFVNVQIGQVISINHNDYGLANADFRVVQKDESDNTSNSLKLRLTQMLEGLSDDSYFPGGGSEWLTPSYSPKPLVHQRVFELPYNSQTNFSSAYLLLAARVGVETKFISMTSFGGVDYQTHSEHQTYSQYGTLDEAYNAADTYWLDDEKGILFTPYRDDPEFNTVSRTELFGEMRCAIIGDEMIGFQTVTPEGASSVRLTGCIRGILNTPIQDHAVSDDIWLTTVGNSILRGMSSVDFYVKLIPYFGVEMIDPADALPIHVVGEHKASTPWPVGRIKAVRLGSAIAVTIWPVTRIYPGAGVLDMESHTDQWPPSFDGSFEYKLSLSGTIISADEVEWNYVQSGDHDLYVRHVISGFTSPWVYANVEAADGTYIGPEL